MTLVKTMQPRPVGNSAHIQFKMQPVITSSTLLRASDKEKQSLRDIHELLSSIFIRNRNQHRRSHWFKSLQQFRTQLALLIQELEGKSKSSVAGKLTQRLQFWDERCVHQWYIHFTQLVANAPFAVLGLTLMACTARVCKVTGITDSYEEIASEDMHTVMSMIDKGDVEDELGGALAPGEEDEGEVVERSLTWE